jgi:hypothetical protein
MMSDDGREMFLRDVWPSPDYVVLQLTRPPALFAVGTVRTHETQGIVTDVSRAGSVSRNITSAQKGPWNGHTAMGCGGRCLVGANDDGDDEFAVARLLA